MFIVTKGLVACSGVVIPTLISMAYWLLVMPCLSASSVMIFVATVLKIVMSLVSFSFFVSPIFVGTLFCMTYASCVAVVIIVSTLVNVGTVIYWCLKHTMSATLMLLVFLTHIL